MKKVLFLVFALSLICLSQANADLYSFTFTGDTSTTVTGNLTATPNGGGSFTVSGGSGLVNGTIPIVLVANTNAPNVSTSPSGYFYFDNQLSPAVNPQITNSGLLFKTASYEVNIYSNGPGSYTYYDSKGFYESGTFKASAVPIPAAIWLFGAGLVGLVGVRRRFKA